MKEEVTKGEDIFTRKEIGKVFKTETPYNLCPCGETVEQRKYQCLYYSKSGKMSIEHVLGFCKCGNVFLTKFSN